MSIPVATLRILMIGIVLVYLSACNSGPFSGAGAMRIEVEVYKGPLSQEPNIQWGELVGYLEEAKRSFVENANFTLAVVDNKDFNKGFLSFLKSFVFSFRNKQLQHVEVSRLTSYATNQSPSDTVPMDLIVPGESKDPELPFKRITWCDELDPEGAWDQLDYFDCVMLRGVYTDNLDIIRKVSLLLEFYKDSLRKPEVEKEVGEKILRDVAELSSELRAKGFRWAVATTAGQSYQVKVRIAIMNFVVSASEFGNQLQSRADTLMKQVAGYGDDRRELPLSSYLREAEATGFIHLYDWLNAGLDAVLPYKLSEFVFSGMWPIHIRDRIKVVDRLFADRFWSKVNTVYASGKGKVGMAFIKDELGNWNLKNFDTAPGELLDSYMKLGVSLVKRAADLAVSIETGGSADSLKTIQGLLKEAQDVQGSMQASPTSEMEANNRLQALKKKTLHALEALMLQREEKDKTISRELAKAVGKSDETKIKKELTYHRKQSHTEIQEILFAFKQQLGLIDRVVNPQDKKIGATQETLANKE